MWKGLWESWTTSTAGDVWGGGLCHLLALEDWGDRVSEKLTYLCTLLNVSSRICPLLHIQQGYVIQYLRWLKVYENVEPQRMKSPPPHRLAGEPRMRVCVPSGFVAVYRWARSDCFVSQSGFISTCVSFEFTCVRFVGIAVLTEVIKTNIHSFYQGAYKLFVSYRSDERIEVCISIKVK